MSVLHNPPSSPQSATAIPLQKGSGLAEKIVAAAETIRQADLLVTIQEKYKSLPENEGRKALAREIRNRRKDIKKDMRKHDETREKLKQLNLAERIGDEFTAWLQSRDPIRLQKPTPGATQSFRDAMLDGAAFDFSMAVDDITKPEWREDFEREVLSEAQTFVVEHDWASAFQKSDVLKDAKVNLPYEVCCFEFLVSGRRVVAVAVQDGETVHLNVAAEAREGWGVIRGGVKHISDQITAVCIALDAEIAYTEAVRVPSLRNSRPPSAPQSDYHVVSLSRRSLARPLPAPDGAAHGGRRLHFRRGHWRHLEKHKVWVKWCLVGDPDLGFVDKHYRL